MALVTTTRRATPAAAAEITTVWIWRIAHSRRVRALILRSADRFVLAATWTRVSTPRRHPASSGESRSANRQCTPSALPRSVPSPTTVPMALPAAERASSARAMRSPTGVAAPVTATVIVVRRERIRTLGELTGTSSCLPIERSSSQEIKESRVSDHPQQGPANPDEPDEPDFAALLASILGSADNPEVAKALAAMGIDKMDPGTMAIIGAQLKSMLSGDHTEPFNVELATDVARKSVAAEGDSTVGDVARREIEQAVEVAHLWIDAVTDLPAPAGAVHAWSRAEWVDQTMPMWRELVEPVAAGVSTAVVAAMRSQMGQLGEGEDLSAIPGLPAGLPAGMDPSALMGQVEPMLARMSGTMFGIQVGQAVGALAGTLVSGTDVGLPLVPHHGVALLPANIATFAEGLEVDLAEVRLYLAVREAARVRLFAEVPWLGSGVNNE